MTVLAEGEWADFTLRASVRMALGTVTIGGRPLAKRHVLRAIARAWCAQWDWATALPGDLFYSPQTEVYIEVHAGLPDRRYIKAVTREQIARYGDEAWSRTRPHRTFNRHPLLVRA